MEKNIFPRVGLLDIFTYPVIPVMLAVLVAIFLMWALAYALKKDKKK